jgi:hypothetical protein
MHAEARAGDPLDLVDVAQDMPGRSCRRLDVA